MTDPRPGTELVTTAARVAGRLALVLLAGLVLVPLAPAASTTLVINEVLFDPAGADAGAEQVELMARNTVGVQGVALSDQDGNSVTVAAALTLAPGEILVVHLGAGADDLTGPVYHVYSGTAVEWLDNAGDDLLLSDGGGTPLDYIAYGAGAAVSPPPGGIVWAGAIDVAAVEAGHSVGLASDAADTDTAAAWAEFDSPTMGLPNGSAALDVTKSGSASLSRGDADGGSYTLTVANTGTGPAYGLSLEDDYPAGFTLVAVGSVQRNGQAVAAVPVDDGDRVLLGGLPALLPGDVLTAELTLAAGCGAATGFVSNAATARYHDLPDLSDGTQTAQPPGVFDIAVLRGSLRVVLEAVAVNGVPIAPTGTPAAEVDDVVTFRVSLQNSGDGDLFDVTSQVDWEAGLAYVGGSLTGSGVTAGTVDTSVPADGEPDRITAAVSGPSLPAGTSGDTVAYTFDLQVTVCEGLTAEASAAERCLGAETLNSAVALQVKTPDLDYTLSPASFTIPYGGTLSVTAQVTNAGNGAARAFVLDTGLENAPLAVTLDPASQTAGWSYTPGTGRFSYAGSIAAAGDPGGGDSVTLNFELALQPPLCANRSPSGTILLEPFYQSVCQDDFFAPRGFTTYSTTGVPSISITKGGPAGLYAAVGDPVTYIVAVTYPDPPGGIPDPIVVEDTLPPGIVLTAPVAVTAGSLAVDGATYTWTLDPSEADGAQMTISGQVDPTDPCLQGTRITNTARLLGATDVAGCDLAVDNTAAATLYINNSPDNTVAQRKGVAPPGFVAACDPAGTVITNAYVIGTGVVGSWTGSAFSDELGGGVFTYLAGTAEVRFDSDDTAGQSFGAWTAVPSGSVTLDGGGRLSIDLTFLADLDDDLDDDPGDGLPDDFVRGNEIELRYTVYVCESALAGAAQTVNTLSDLILAGNGGSCQDPGQTGRFVQQLLVEARRADIGLGIDLDLPDSQIEDCQTVRDVVLTVSNAAGVAYHDLTIDLDTTNYLYLGNLAVAGFDGQPPSVTLRDAADAITADPETAVRAVFDFDATGAPDPLSDGGTLTFDVRKRCGTPATVSAAAGFTSRADSGWAADQACGAGVTCGGVRRFVSAGDQPILANRGDLIVTVTPEDYPVATRRLEWQIYVTNRGSGTAYGARVQTVLDANLSYVDSTVDGAAPVVTVSADTPAAGDTTLVWDLGDLDKSQTRVVTVRVDTTGQSCDFSAASSISVQWGCGSTVCQSLPAVAAPRFSQPRAEAIAANSFVGDILACAEGQVLLRVRNVGNAAIYRAEAIQDLLATNLALVSGSVEVTTNDDDTGWTPAALPADYDPSVSGTQLTWQGHTPLAAGYLPDLAEIAVGASVWLRYTVEADCSLPENPVITATGRYQKPCQAGSDVQLAGNTEPIGVQLRTTPVRAPDVSVAVTARNATTGQAFTSGNVYAAAGDTIAYAVTVSHTGSAPDPDARHVRLTDLLPANLTFAGITRQGGGPAPVAVIPGQVWDIEDLAPGDVDVYIITATVDGCAADAANTAEVSFGCPPTALHPAGCRTFTRSGAHGGLGKVVTRPDVTAATALVSGALTVCGGDLTVSVTNRGAPTRSGAGVVVQPDLPAGWQYDPSGGTSVTFDPPDVHTVALDASDLARPAWTIDGLDTDETVTVTLHLAPDGTLCDTDRLSDPAPPAPLMVSGEVTITNTCNDPPTLLQPQTAITPTYADVDVALAPATQIVAPGGTATLLVTLTNNGTAPADDLGLVMRLGAGFNVTSAEHGAAVANGPDPRTVTWTNGQINGGAGLAPGAVWTARVEATVTAGNLQVWADVDGLCRDAAGNAVTCRHSFDRAEKQAAVAGVGFAKTVVAVGEPGGLVDPHTATATVGNVPTFEIGLELLGEGTYTDLVVSDLLPAGFELVAVGLDGDADGSVAAVPLDGTYSPPDGGLRAALATIDGTLAITLDADGVAPPSFSAGAGGRTVTLQLQARVRDAADNTADPETVLVNGAFVDFGYDNGDGSAIAFDHTAFPALADQAAVTVTEPRLTVAKAYPGWGTTYSSGSPRRVAAAESVAFTITVQNAVTRATPVFDGVVTDLLPTGLRDTAPSLTAVFVDTNADGALDGGDRDLGLPPTPAYNATWDGTTLTVALDSGASGDTANTNVIGPGEQLVIAYTAVVDPDAGAGLVLDNAVQVAGSGLRGAPAAPQGPERAVTAGPAITRLITGDPVVFKGAALANSLVADGDRLTYTLRFPRPLQEVFLYGDDDDATPGGAPEFSDVVPDGLEIVDVAVTVNATRVCDTVGGLVIPPVGASIDACAATDDRVVSTAVSPVGGAGRDRRVEIDFNRFYPGDYLVVTIDTRARPTFDDETTVIPPGHVLVNRGSVTVYTKPSGDPDRAAVSVDSNPVESRYEKLIGITPDFSGQGIPGSTVSYAHTVTNRTAVDEPVCFSVASTYGWNWFVTDAGGTVLRDDVSGSVAPLTVPAGAAVTVTLRAFVPAATPLGTVERTDLLLHPWSAGCREEVFYDSVVDTTTVNRSRLRLSKTVRRCTPGDVNVCPDPFAVANQAEPCAYLEYRIAFDNQAAGAYQRLTINDVVPPATVFVPDVYPGGRDVLVRLPDGSTVYRDATLSARTLRVDLSADIPALLPQQGGWIQYKVRLEGDGCP